MTTEDPRKRIREWGWNTLRALTPALALLLLLLAYFLGIRTERSGFVREVITPVMQRVTTPVLNAFRGGVPDVPEFAIAMDTMAMDSLVQAQVMRSDGTGTGLRFLGELQWGDSSLKCVLQLQDLPGIDPSAEASAIWSVQLGGLDTFLGMQRFRLLPAHDDAHLRGMLMALLLEDQGLPALPARFAEVQLPGTDRAALYAMSALPDSLIWQRWGHAPAPIVRYSDELLRPSAAARGTFSYPVAPSLQSDWMSAPIITTTTGRAEDQGKAITALEQFRSGRATASEVFDTDALSRLLALCDLFGAQASLEWWNLRSFPHHATGRLVPLLWTPDAARPIEAITALRMPSPLRFPNPGPSFLERLFSDPLLYQRYIIALDSMSTDGRVDSALARVMRRFEPEERILRGYFPEQRIDREVFAHNIQVIRSTLQPKDLLLAYMEDRQGPVDRLAIANVHALPVEVQAVVFGTDTIALQGMGPFWPREKGKPLTYRMVPVNASSAQSGQPRLLARIVGTDRTVSVPVRTWSTFRAMQ
jgi:hypothetical protein